MAPPITRLAADDLPACLDLAADRGWTPDPRKWALLLDRCEVYGIRDPGGDGLAGSVMLARYGRRLAVVGLMLVATRHGRRGLGRRMMEYALERARGATVFLYATSYGRPLYERLGFRVVGAATTAIGRFTGAPDGASRHAVPGDGGAILALDAAAIGADRGHLLAAYLGLAEQVRVVERGGELRGYAVAAPAVDQLVVGPVVAHDVATARTLIADMAGTADGPVRLDVDHRLRDWAHEHGLTPGDDAALMVHGDRDLPGARERVLTPMTLALG
jgi:GNAT superfamily N-acetyltransferase